MDTTQLGLPGFGNINYKGKPVKREGFTGIMRVIVMQKNNPDRLDMRYRTNKQFMAEQQKWRADHKPADDSFAREYLNKPFEPAD